MEDLSGIKIAVEYTRINRYKDNKITHGTQFRSDERPVNFNDRVMLCAVRMRDTTPAVIERERAGLLLLFFFKCI